MQATRQFANNHCYRLILLLLACTMVACSAIRLSYDNGSGLLYMWLDGYADFNARQSPWVKQSVDGFLSWHRKTELKEYVQFLTLVQKQLQGNITQADLEADLAEFKRRSLVLLGKALPELADIALSLTPEQLLHMERKYAANSEEFRKDYLRGDAVQRQQFRYKKAMRHVETLFGDFSREQEQEIRKASEARPLNNEIWFTEQAKRQKASIALLRKIQKEKPERDAVIALLREHVRRNIEQLDSPEHKDFFDAYTNSLLQFVHSVIKLTTPAQKAHANMKMQSWIDDLNRLAAESR